VFAAVPAPALRVIVADNSPAAEAAQACRQRHGAWPLHYVHEPRPGISHARNTALAAVPPDTDFIAIIDDDEVPAPDWLDQMLQAQRQSAADVVAGGTNPVFPPGTPGWVAATGFFLKPQTTDLLPDHDLRPPTATSNVLVRGELLGEDGVSFDPALGRSGGEDKLLFQTLKQRGLRFTWAAAAAVDEHIPPERANLRYMCRESYRRGSVIFFIKKQVKSRSAWHTLRIGLRLSVRALFGLLFHFALLLAYLPRGRQAWVPQLLYMARCLGTLAGVLQLPNYHYRNGDDGC